MEEKKKHKYPDKFEEIADRLDLPSVEEIDELLKLDAPQSSHRHQVLKFPKGVEVLRMMNELEISVDWKQSGSKFPISFGLIWNSFLAMIFSFVIASGAWGMIFMMIPFIAAGLYMMGISVMMLVNETHISVDEQHLTMTHTPLKMGVYKDKRFRVEDINQVYSKKTVAGSVNNEPKYSYEVWMRLTNGKHLMLVKNLKSAEYARFVEYQIETYAGIKDKRVTGEIEYK